MKKVLLLSGVFLLGAVFLSDRTCDAQKRPLGPSARAAAQLKKSPPANWVGYYLPDDRYKVAGRIWKFVAPDVGRTYYLPWSQPILAQLKRNAGGIIGFSSAREAQEAGYQPGLDIVR